MANFLSSHDVAVLGALFDPEASLRPAASIQSSPAPSHKNYEMSKVRDEETTALRIINSPFPKKADLEEAICKLTSIIQTYPEEASPYNNRAQARRMLADRDGLNSSMLDQVMDDLSRAISLASPSNGSTIVGPNAVRVLASAHTHRGFLLLAASKSSQLAASLPLRTDSQSPTAEDLEERASNDFALGSRYGNQMAKQMAVKTNPYAKLCGSIVKEALRKELACG